MWILGLKGSMDTCDVEIVLKWTTRVLTLFNVVRLDFLWKIPPKFELH